MSTFYQLDFERDILDLERRISDAETRGGAPAEVPALGGVEQTTAQQRADLQSLRRQRDQRLQEVYRELTPWQTVRVARHPDRPQTRDYVKLMCRDFCELHGDRAFGDDHAIVTGFARLGHHKVMLIGHQKGRDTAEKLRCHFGCAHPEGYRKALAKMKAAEKFGLPIVTLVDTPGAYPGLGAEQRGQAHAIAVNLREMSRLRVPIVSIIIGEGGSGGALGVAVADRVAMLRHAWYSVISPEGCAAILWKKAEDETNESAARALRLTADDNRKNGVVDAVIDEPLGGAHRNPEAAGDTLKRWIISQLDELTATEIDELLEARYQRFRGLGSFDEPPPEPETHSEPDDAVETNPDTGGPQ